MKKRWRVLLKVFGVAAVLFVIWCVLHRAYWQRQFDRRVAELKVDGQLVSFEDLDAHDSLPVGVPNAADIYMKAFSHYQEPDEADLPFLPIQGSYNMPDDNSSLPNDVLVAIAKSLEANKRTLELLDQGAREKYCVLPRDRSLDMYEQGFLDKIKNCSELLCD